MSGTPRFVTVRFAKNNWLPWEVWNAEQSRKIAAFASERQFQQSLPSIIETEARDAGYEIEKASASPIGWTKAELEKWAQGWSRTPATVLKAFIDAGLCSDQSPAREETRLIEQMTRKPAEFASCPECNGDGWVVGIGIEARDQCCGGSNWECGARGCTGPIQVQEQIQVQECCGGCGGEGIVPAQAIEARRAETAQQAPSQDESAVAESDAP